MVIKRGAGGRPNKGERDLIASRLPTELGDAVRMAADEHGMTISDYVAKILAEALSLPQFAPEAHLASDQGEFPIAKGGVRLQRTA